MKEDKKISNLQKGWNSKTIYLDKESHNQIDDICKTVLIDLENYHRDFLEDRNNFSTLETEDHLSPLTVFDGKWGTGKTYFITRFKEYFESIEKTDDRYFKDILYINALDLADDPSLITAFLLGLFKNNLTVTKKIKRWFRKALDKSEGVFNLIGDIKAMNLQRNDPKNREVERFEKNIKVVNRTIIFIDNLERMEGDSVKILRLLYKLRVVENLYFILVTNLNVLKSEFLILNSAGEKNLVKYINTPGYKFEQNYSSALLSLNNDSIEISSIECDLINDFFSNEDENEQLTIREFKNWIYNHQYLNSSIIERYKKLYQIDKELFKNSFAFAYKEEIESYVDVLVKIQTEVKTFYDYIHNGIIDPIFANDPGIIAKNGCLYSNGIGYVKENNGKVISSYYRRMSNNIFIRPNEYDIIRGNYSSSRISVEEIKKERNGINVEYQYEPILNWFEKANKNFESDIDKAINKLDEAHTINELINHLRNVAYVETRAMEELEAKYIEKIENLDASEGDYKKINDYFIEHSLNTKILNIFESLKKIAQIKDDLVKLDFDHEFNLKDLENNVSNVESMIKNKLFELLDTNLK